MATLSEARCNFQGSIERLQRYCPSNAMSLLSHHSSIKVTNSVLQYSFRAKLIHDHNGCIVSFVSYLLLTFIEGTLDLCNFVFHNVTLVIYSLVTLVIQK